MVLWSLCVLVGWVGPAHVVAAQGLIQQSKVGVRVICALAGPLC